MTSEDPKSSRLRWILIALFFLWMALVLAGYYLVQNAFLQPVFQGLSEFDGWLPFRISLPAIGRSLVDLIFAIWISWAALGVGRWILATLFKRPLIPLEDFLFGLGLGFGTLALVVLLLGVVGLISQPIFLLILASLTLITTRSTYRFIRTLRIPRPGLLILLLLFAALFLALTLALLPPTSWDGLFYHLTGPKLYLDAGRIVPGIDIPHLNFPSLFEMLYLLAIAVRGGVTAVLLHYIFAILLIGLVYLIARESLGVKNAWTAVVFLLAMPMVLTLAGWAYNDLALAFYEVAALYGLLKWNSRRGRQDRPHPVADSSDILDESKPKADLSGSAWLALSGILLGFAMGLKYTSVIALVSLAALILWWYRKELRWALKPLLLFAGLALLVASPWFVKNLLFTGNPVYPFVFGGTDWDEFRSSAYSEGGTGIAFDPSSCTNYSPEYLVGQHPTECEFDPVYLATRLILLPFDITLEIRDASRDGPMGPLFLVFLPLLVVFGVFAKRPDRPAAMGGLLFFALAQFIFWTIGVMSSAALWQSRLLLPAFVALCPALSWLLEELATLDHPRFSLQRMLYLVIGLVLLAGLFIQTVYWLPEQPWGYILGRESTEQNLDRRLGSHYEVMEYINSETPEDAVILFLWEPRSYYCDRDCRPDSILDAFGHLQHVHGDASNIISALRVDGITHILLFEKGLDLVLEAKSPTNDPLDEPIVLADLREKFLTPVTTFGEEWYTLYEIGDAP